MKSFAKIFRESFKVDDAWTDWFMSRVGQPEHLVTVDVDDVPVSAALLSPYTIDFHGSDVPVCYINSVATARKSRGHGYGTMLMYKALRAAAERGDDFAVLIPATRRLYFFYDAFDFATVFYIDEQRYTSLHAFEAPQWYEAVDATWDMFHSLEQMRTGAVRHTEQDFENILTDLALSDGQAMAVSNADGSQAMIFFEKGDSYVHVLDVLATDDGAREAVMQAMRAVAPDRTVLVRAMPEGREAQLRSRAMARILNVESVLGRVAETHPEVEQVIRVHDRIIPSNDAIYILHKGKCEKVADTNRRITLDVNVDVLCKILFSSPKIGDVFGLPTHRPFISLMLD